MSEAKSKKVIQSFMSLLEDHFFEEVTLEKIAEASDLSLSELRKLFDGKVAILSAFSKQIDTQVLKEIDVDVADEMARERLMDVLLSRFDALQPYKKSVATLLKAARSDLALSAQLNRIAMISMTWMLNAARIDTGGVQGAIRVQGTAMVFARVLAVWVKDDESMAKTMAMLDRELRKGERNMNRFNRASSLLKPLKNLRKRNRKETAEEVLDS